MACYNLPRGSISNETTKENFFPWQYPKGKGGAVPSAKLGACLTRIALRLEPESSVQICPSGKSQLNSSPLVQEAGGEIFSMVRTIARIVIQSQVQSEVLGRQVGLFSNNKFTTIKMKIKFANIMMAGITQKKLKSYISIAITFENEKGRLQCRTVLSKR